MHRTIRASVILQAFEEGGNEYYLHRHSGGVDPCGNRIGIAISAPLTTCCGSHACCGLTCVVPGSAYGG